MIVASRLPAPSIPTNRVGSRRDAPALQQAFCASPFLLAAAFILIGISGAPAGGVPPSGPGHPADLVVKNGAIYTVDASRRWASAMAVREGRIVFVGEDAEAARLQGPATRVVDLAGRLVLPAFHDSHVHPISAGIERAWCGLSGARSAEELLERVRAWARDHPNRPWVLGSGWDQSLFPGGVPARELLDGAVPDRPALLLAGDGGHSAWANAKAMTLAEIGKHTPDPVGGRIQRDPASGEPTGLLREAAVGLVSRHVPEPSAREKVEALTLAMGEMASAGIVSFQDASVDPSEVDAYRAAAARGDFPARARLALHFDEEEDSSRDEDQVGRLLRTRDAVSGRRLSAGTVKLFLDGVIEGRTAALLEPYLPEPGGEHAAPSSGLPNFTQERLDAVVARLDRQGFQIHMHAIGDGAIRMGLDALERASRANGRRDSRHHLAHIQLFHPQDVPRFRALGAVANFQPFWAYADGYITKLTEPVLGPERSRRLYPIRSLADSGAVLCAGSDWPVTTLDPLAAIQVAVTRQATDSSTIPWLPEQRIDLARMIAAYTIGGAYVNFEEADGGSLEPGKWADFIVLDRNLFEIEPAQIHQTKVLWTVVEGREVYRTSDWSRP